MVLVGNSLGAWVAMLYAHDYPAHVARLVAINGGAITNVNPAINLYPETREEARETMKALMGPATLPVPDFVLDDIIRHARVGPAGRLVQTRRRDGGPTCSTAASTRWWCRSSWCGATPTGLWTLDVRAGVCSTGCRERGCTRSMAAATCRTASVRTRLLEAIEKALAMPPPELIVEEEDAAQRRRRRPEQ